MQKIREANVRRNRRTCLFALVITLILCTSLLVQTYRMNQDNKEAQAKYESLQTQATSESKKGDELEEKREYVRSDAYIESIARERLGLVKKDEILIKSEDN